MVKGKTRYHRAYLRLHKQYETFAYPVVKKALDEQVKVASALITDENYDSVDFYIQYLPSEPIKQALEEIYPPIGASAAKFSYQYIQSYEQKSLLDFFNAEWLQQMMDYFLLNAGQKIRGITDTTIKRIREVIAQAQSQNLSRREEAKYIQETLNDPEFNRNRAFVISRTESTTAANYGINLGAESSDYYVQKYWLDTKDKRTRHDHIIAGLQPPIPMNTPFYVGGNPMMYPGDATAPADEVVNCRCVMGTSVITDADGLPVLKPRKTNAERAGNANGIFA